MSRSLKSLLVLLALTASSAAFAQGTPPAEEPQPVSELAATADDGQDLARQLSNPVASLISVPFQQNLDIGGGPRDMGVRYTMNVQPVIPISISDDANLIVRTIVPIVYQNELSGPNQSEFGLGDTVQSFFYSPKAPTRGGIIWGAGPVFLFPTATSRFTGGEKWGAGPTFVVLKQAGQSTFGLLANHIWSFAGDSSRNDISATFIQPFYSFTTKRATTYSFNTESTYNWQTKKWIVPVNVSVSQLMRIGKQPVSLGIGGRYYISSPTGGPTWGMRFTTTLLFPKG
ncbi:hypothetical protein [Sphingomonas daechungensis]|uniref:hypothetical protein n=1 Tax=Sphingomonas daechungensis TaxID=1176646 RepID=UPI00378418BD